MHFKNLHGIRYVYDGGIRCFDTPPMEQKHPSPQNSQATGLQRKRHLDLSDRRCNRVNWSALPRPSCWSGTKLPQRFASSLTALTHMHLACSQACEIRSRGFLH